MTDPQESSLISVWVIVLEDGFRWLLDNPHRLMIKKTDYIDDMAMEATRRFNLGSGVVFKSIQKILNPLEAEFKHSYKLRSSSQLHTPNITPTSPKSLNELVARLKAGNTQSIKPILTTDVVGNHFGDKGTLIQAVVQFSIVSTGAEAEKKKCKREESSSTQIKPPLIQHLENIATGSPPSDVSGEHGIKLRKDILFGRPTGQYALPVALYDQHLAQLQYKLSKLDATLEESDALFKDADAYLDISRQFLEAAIADHTSQSSWTASKSYFETLFGANLLEEFRIPRTGQPSNANGQPTARADACVVTNLHVKDDKGEDCIAQIPYIYFEFKKDKGFGDPIAQCAKASAEVVYGLKDQPFFFSTCFPAVFLALNGHSLEISISACLEYLVVDNILQLDLRDSVQRTRMIRQLAYIASALAECSKALGDEYRKVSQSKESRHPLQPCFPQPTLHPSETSNAPLPKLEFQGRLSRKNDLIDRLASPLPSDMRSLLVAGMGEGKDAPRAVVKFVEKYGNEAHEILANENLAPKLYYYRRVLGDMYMVVMEHLEGWQPMKQFSKGRLSDSVFEDIKKALEKLGKSDYVHGDLRAVNIMIDATKQHAKIVDFDWAAKEGEGRYSLAINTAELKNEWHPDVWAGEKMMKEHDKYALEEVLMLNYK